MILVLADDMTGALEAGAVFAAAGFRAVVSTSMIAEPDCEVLVLDTETRHCSPAAAFDRVVELVRSLQPAPEFIYKKTDSTLRGNIRSELSGLCSLFPDWRMGYAPAYPGQGRTVEAGVLYVNGIPVSQTSFANDQLNPVVTSCVRDLVGSELPCTIFDGLCDLDVKNAAAAILSDGKMRIAAGPAALASALALQLQGGRSGAIVFPSVETCVVLNGSRTGLAEAQIRHAEQHGCVGRNWSLAEPVIAPDSASPAVAALRAEHVIALLRQRPADAILLIGGDTAYAFVAALNHPPLAPIAEVVPGVALSRIENSRLRSRLPEYEGDLILITKAGGFGEVDVLCRVRRILEKNAA